MDANKIGIAVNDVAGNITIEFDRPVTNLSFSPENAAMFAKAIAERVVKVTPQSPIILPSHH